MSEIMKAVMFGIVEGITEWLPVSSTGHMILLEELMPFSEGALSSGFMEMFLVVIQLGAILAVAEKYWGQLLPVTFQRRRLTVKKEVLHIWVLLVTACIPAVLTELVFGDAMETMFYRYEVVATMLILFGIFFLLAERRNRNRKPVVNRMGELTLQTAFLIGIFQMIAAVFPGTSRSGATILGALLLGVSRTTAAEFTFLLAVPVMFGASFLKLWKFGMNFSSQELSVLIVGMVVAFVVSEAVIRLLLEYMKKHDFRVFGYYRIVLGVVVLLGYPRLRG